MPSERPSSRQSPRTNSHAIRTRVWSAGRVLILALALGVTFGTFFLTGMRVANRARDVRVPDLQGLPLVEATQASRSAGLELRIEARRADGTVPRDHVIAQEPEPGSTLRRQRAVRVRVSDGQQAPVVPVVVGQNERTAEMVLSQEKIEVGGRVEIRTNAYATGVVVAQDPAGSQQAAKVTLLVNRGESGAGFVMPDVIGAQGARVVDVLRRRGFRVTVGAQVPYPGLPAGIVVRQTPQAGFQIGYGDAVVLEISQ
jgi:beta-lactam-binding protein with PASTA domain